MYKAGAPPYIMSVPVCLAWPRGWSLLLWWPILVARKRPTIAKHGTQHVAKQLIFSPQNNSFFTTTISIASVFVCAPRTVLLLFVCLFLFYFIFFNFIQIWVF